MKLRHLLALLVLATGSCAYADSVGFYYQNSNSTISVQQSDNNQSYGYGHGGYDNRHPSMHKGQYKPHKFAKRYGPNFDKRHQRKEMARFEHEHGKYAMNRMAKPKRSHHDRDF